MSLPVVEILGQLWELPHAALRDRWARCVGLGVEGARLQVGGAPYDWTSRATIESIEARAGEWLMFHAAGLSDEHGRVAALIGPSGTGKSTAARTLCRDHFGYVTDETVAITADDLVVPFPKPIAVVPSDGGIKTELGPDELGLRHCADDLTLGGVILLERQPHLTGVVVEAMGLFEGLLAIVPHTSALSHLRGGLARLATVVERCGGVHKITYGDASQLTDAVSEVLAAPPVRSDFLSHGVGPADDGSCGVFRTWHQDAIERDGQVLVLKDSSCVLLKGIGSLVWLAADKPRPMHELRQAVVDAAGDHPEADTLIQEAMGELRSLGLMASR